MPKHLQKSLQEYLSKIKKPSPHVQFNSSTSLPSSTNWILSGCKHPKTLSFAVDHRQDESSSSHDRNGGDAATLADVDRFLFENFKSLYGKSKSDNNNNEDNHHHHKKKTGGGGGGGGGGGDLEGNNNNNNTKLENSGCHLFDSPRFDLPPDLCGSNRFFVRPGMSSSLVEEEAPRPSGTTTSSVDTACSSSTSTTTTTTTSTTTLLNDSTSGGGNNNSDDRHHVKEEELASLSDECIAILSYSSNPYDDFRRSMHEMVEARVHHHHAKVDWDFMEELLFCYLNLNDKKSYKYILSAFVDLIVVLRQSNSRKAPARSSRRVRIAGERRKKRESIVT